MNIKTRCSGFTLIELLLALAVVAVVLSLAVPSFQPMIVENRIVSQINEVSSLVGFARSEATKRPDVFITLCPSTDKANCSGGTAWETGWIVLLDVDGDRTFDTGDQVLKVAGSLAGGNSLRVAGFTSASFVQFSKNGQPIPTGAVTASPGTFTLCDSRGATSARAIVVMVSGQTRLARDEDAVPDGIVNGHDADDVSCP